MRVLHLVSEPGPRGRGVSQKVADTVACWRRLGVDADHLDLATGAIGFDGLMDDADVRTRPSGRAGWILEMERRVRRVLEVLEREAPDLVYTRELVWSPAVERMFRRHRVVLEINSDSGRELADRSAAAAGFWRITSRRLRRRAAGIVSVTPELAGRLVPPFVPSAVVPNATDVPVEAPPRRPDAARPLLLMLVGGGNAWQGLDRLDALANAMPQFEFAFCGDAGSAAEGLSDRLVRLAPVHGEDLAELLARTTVGVGTLALSRKGMTQACPLKSRTVLAAGVPLLYAYDDPALEDDRPFALRVADRPEWAESDLARIEAFVHRTTLEPELGEAAWRYARANLDREVVEQARLEFMRSLLPAPIRVPGH